MAPAAKVTKSYAEINARIKKGEAVVVTAEEMIGIVSKEGPEKAARKVDVVTTGTFGPMCSSGAFLNFGHSKPKVKAKKAWLNSVAAYAGLAAVDLYIGATELAEGDPENKVYPGKFLYGGAHVIEDLVAGRDVRMKVEAYGTDCYPRKELESLLRLADLNECYLFNPRNAYQNYNCAVNFGKKMIYTYMGGLRPNLGNANYCSAGQLSPLLNDPYHRTIGIGTRIFIGGGTGYVVGCGTQHNPQVKRGENGVVRAPAGTLAVSGDLRGMTPEYVKGLSFQGYGTSLGIGIGIPIPILNAEIARSTGVSDEENYTQIVDYSVDYPE
ncbi:MAG: homocysteine biosynthesis protein, partial [bacterium]|nr:homocysteine biosynthesis protein [bacterium]